MLLDKLHSIPINKRSYEEHYKLSHVSNCSIPLVCMVALLLLGVMIFNPKPNEVVGAVSIGEATEVSDEQATNADEGIMELANVNPSLALTISNSDKEISTVQGGNTAYSDHLVTITGQEVTNYTLSMSSTSSNLTKPSGSSGANITGAGGVTGDKMTANKWGYAVTEESNSSYGGLTYNTVPTSTTTIANGNAASDNTLSVKKKLVFAAKFGEDAAAGNYRQSTALSAVASATMVTFKITYNSNGGGTAPTASTETSTANSAIFTLPGQGSMSKSGYAFVGWSTDQNATTGSTAGSSYTVNRANPQITLYAVWKSTLGIWSNGVNTGVTNMQDIPSGFCRNNSNVPAGETIKLKDNRAGGTVYKIMKMNDGKCWMVDNLKLSGRASLNSSNSDVTSAYTLPANQAIDGEIKDWGTDKTSQNMAEGRDGMKINGSGAWNTAYGNYYSWCTATAGTCTDSGDAPSSICPKGWTLPSNTDTNIGTYSGLNSAFAGSWTTIGGVNGIKLGYNSNDAFFPAAGRVNGNGLDDSGSYGYYWSSTVYSSNVNRAYALYYDGGNASTSNSGRYVGFSVRCVARQ